MRTQGRRTDAFDSLSVRYANGLRHAPPLPGRSKIYGAILYCSQTQRYALVQGRQTGKWSFPKGHVNRFETPFECVTREVKEEVGLNILPTPKRGVPLGVGYYYYFEVNEELELKPIDIEEVEKAGWYTISEMSSMRLNIDASTYTRIMTL